MSVATPYIFPPFLLQKLNFYDKILRRLVKTKSNLVKIIQDLVKILRRLVHLTSNFIDFIALQIKTHLKLS